MKCYNEECDYFDRNFKRNCYIFKKKKDVCGCAEYKKKPVFATEADTDYLGKVAIVPRKNDSVFKFKNKFITLGPGYYEIRKDGIFKKVTDIT